MNFLKFVLWLTIWSILVNVMYVIEYNFHPVIEITITSNQLIVLFKSSVVFFSTLSLIERGI